MSADDTKETLLSVMCRLDNLEKLLQLKQDARNKMNDERNTEKTTMQCTIDFLRKELKEKDAYVAELQGKIVIPTPQETSSDVEVIPDSDFGKLFKLLKVLMDGTEIRTDDTQSFGDVTDEDFNPEVGERSCMYFVQRFAEDMVKNGSLKPMEATFSRDAEDEDSDPQWRIRPVTMGDESKMDWDSVLDIMNEEQVIYEQRKDHPSYYGLEEAVKEINKLGLSFKIRKRKVKGFLLKKKIIEYYMDERDEDEEPPSKKRKEE